MSFCLVFFAFGVPGSVALILAIIFKLREPKRHFQEGPHPDLGLRINVRFFLAANAALILFVLALELIPCAVTIKAAPSDDPFSGLIAVISIATFAILGLLYAVRKGDMSWLDSYRPVSAVSDLESKGMIE